VPKISEAQRTARRTQILDGARRGFARWGFGGATVNRLEAEIGLSRGAIFSYFPSKWDLFYALAREDQRRVGELWLERGFEGMVHHVAEEGPDWLAAYLEVARILRNDPVRRKQWQQRNPELDAQIEAHLAQRRADGIDRSDLPLDSVGMFLGIVLDGISLHLAAGFPVDVESTLELVRSALAPKELPSQL
jgi:TetR/AcrR family transcriptional regulator, transcriptional repressor of aconitase